MDRTSVDLTPPQILYARAASIRAVRGTEVNSFSEAVDALERAAHKAGATVAIVGGLAAIRHRVSVTTVDIDIVVPLGEMAAFLMAVEAQGLHVKKRAADGWHLLEFRHGDETVAVEVLPEGGRTPRDPADAPSIPHPHELGVERGLGYASLAGWVTLKLVAARDKDRYHLVEAMKAATPAEIATCVVAVRKLPPRYMAEFDRLVRAAEDERRE